MSQYASFYLRRGKDDFIFLDEFCRTSFMYKVFNDASYLHWEKLVRVKKEDFHFLISAAEKDKKRLEDRKIELEQQLNLIKEANNSISDKIEAMNDIQEYVKDINCDLSSYDFVINVLHCFESIITNYESGYYSTEKYSIEFYVGLDVNSDPTDADILM